MIHFRNKKFNFVKLKFAESLDLCTEISKYKKNALINYLSKSGKYKILTNNILYYLILVPK